MYYILHIPTGKTFYFSAENQRAPYLARSKREAEQIITTIVKRNDGRYLLAEFEIIRTNK